VKERHELSKLRPAPAVSKRLLPKKRCENYMETIEEEIETQNNSELICDSETHPSSSENTTLQQKENRYGGTALNQLYVNKEHYKPYTSCTMSALTFTLKIYTN
jgi:hypothetical protein